MIRVHIMHNQELVLQGLYQVLDKVSGIRVCGKSKDIAELLELCPELQAEIIILVLSFEDLQKFDCSELKSRTAAKILVMACVNSDESIINAIHRGADGYIMASDTVDELVLAINSLAQGRRFMASSIGFALLTHDKWMRPLKCDRVNLTDRELEILNLMGEGLTNQEIADRLFTSKRTVEGHRCNLLHKTGTRNTAALIKFAMSGRIAMNHN